MNRIQIKEKINHSFETITPNVLKSVLDTEVKKMEKPDYIIEQKTKNKKAIYFSYASVCAVLIFAIGIYSFSNYFQVASFISIDVNPSFEITTNKKEKILNVKALNEDAIKVIGNMELKGIDLTIAVNAIIGSMVKNGYMTQQNNKILVSVINDNPQELEEIQTVIIDDISSSLKSNQIEPVIYNQNTQQNQSEIKNLEHIAGQHHISVGKLLFIEELIKKDSTLSSEILSKMSLDELINLTQKKQIDLSGSVQLHDGTCFSQPTQMQHQSGHHHKN